MAKKLERNDELVIAKIDRALASFCIKGTAPLIYNSMSSRVKRELLMPKGRKTAAEKAASLKHDPLTEFRESLYTTGDETSPTRLQVLSSMFKGAMKTAALDLPGAKKSQIGRLVYVEGDRVSLYGIPRIFMSVTRSADMNRTPDLRTRAIVPQWAARVTIRYADPIINLQSIGNLLIAGGITAGIGDWRVEKGSGNYGTFTVTSEDDPEWQRIVEEGGRAAQDAAIADPQPYDEETAALMSWYESEIVRRGFRVVAS